MTDTRIPYEAGNWIPNLPEGRLYMVWSFRPGEPIPNTVQLRARFRERYGYEAAEVLIAENTGRRIRGIALGPIRRGE